MYFSSLQVIQITFQKLTCQVVRQVPKKETIEDCRGVAPLALYTISSLRVLVGLAKPFTVSYIAILHSHIMANHVKRPPLYSAQQTRLSYR